jgi:carboxylate-amine ligase
MLTVGVEEEFLLLDGTGAVAPVGPDLVDRDNGIGAEYMAYQVELNTGVCTRLDDLRCELAVNRLVAAARAEERGVHLIASGTPPFPRGPLVSLSPEQRYAELARRYPAATAVSGTCSCHVHVGMPDRDLAVEVLGRLRPWLPSLLGLTVNSPFAPFGDGGWSSARYRVQRRWPTFRVPEVCADARDYDRTIDAMIARGAAMDPASVYLLARLSARYPTVEIRVADTCLTVEDTVVYAAIVRALVATLAAEAVRGTRQVPTPTKLVDALLLGAARDGLSERRINLPGPVMGAWPHGADGLLGRITPALEEAGDVETVRAGLVRLHRDGTGAVRQRRLRASAPDPAAFVKTLAAATQEVSGPPSPVRDAAGAAPPH